MAYCDAGAVCYYSDWNTYDTVGLNTRKIATKSITPMQAYGYPSTDLVLLNCGDDPEWQGVMSWESRRNWEIDWRRSATTTPAACPSAP